MQRITTSYRPSVHGFRFINGFRHQIVFDALYTAGSCNGMAHVSCDYWSAGRGAPAIDRVDYGLHPRSGLAAIGAPGFVRLFARGDGDRLVTRIYDHVHQWSAWEGTFGTLCDGPAAACAAPGRIELMTRDDARKIHHKVLREPRDDQRAGVLHLAERIEPGGLTDASPTIAAFPGRTEAYVRGVDGNLYFNCRDDGAAWQTWADLGRPDHVTLASAPAAATAPGWMNAVVRGSDGALWHKEWTHDTWCPWRSAGGVLTSAPAVASPAPGRLEAYGRGQDGALYVNIFDQARWGGWSSLGAPPPGITDDQPAAISWPGYLGVFVRCNDGSVWHRRWTDGRWDPWEPSEPHLSADAGRLTTAIYDRMMASTHSKLIGLGAAVLVLPLAAIVFPLVGAALGYITWKLNSAQDCATWTFTRESDLLRERLLTGKPIPLGLIEPGSGWGHEVVAYEMIIGATSDAHDRPTDREGPDTFVKIYDPNHPGDDEIWLRHDTTARRIVQSTGEPWKGAFVRTDYAPERPPV